MNITKGQTVYVKGNVGGAWQKCKAREDFNTDIERWPLFIYNEEVKTIVEFDPLSERCKMKLTHKPKEKVIKSKIDIWSEIKEIISHSKIKRYPWKLILGDSLTKTILRLKMSNKTAQETYNTIIEGERFQEIKKAFPEHIKKMEQNVFISVCARFGENNTALSLFRKEFSN